MNLGNSDIYLIHFLCIAHHDFILHNANANMLLPLKITNRLQKMRTENLPKGRGKLLVWVIDQSWHCMNSEVANVVNCSQKTLMWIVGLENLTWMSGCGHRSKNNHECPAAAPEFTLQLLFLQTCMLNWIGLCIALLMIACTGAVALILVLKDDLVWLNLQMARLCNPGLFCSRILSSLLTRSSPISVRSQFNKAHMWLPLSKCLITMVC